MNSLTNKTSTFISFALRAVAVAMAAATIVMSVLDAAEVNALITLLGIGLFTLALDALNRGPKPE